MCMVWELYRVGTVHDVIELCVLQDRIMTVQFGNVGRR